MNKAGTAQQGVGRGGMFVCAHHRAIWSTWFMSPRPGVGLVKATATSGETSGHCSHSSSRSLFSQLHPPPSLQTQLLPAQPGSVKSPAPGSLVSGATCLVSCVAARSWFCFLIEPIHLPWLLFMKNQRHCPSQRRQPS